MKRTTTKRKVVARSIPLQWPRQSCVYCNNFIADWCAVFRDFVPRDFWRVENECKHFEESITP